MGEGGTGLSPNPRPAHADEDALRGSPHHLGRSQPAASPRGAAMPCSGCRAGHPRHVPHLTATKTARAGRPTSKVEVLRRNLRRSPSRRYRRGDRIRHPADHLLAPRGQGARALSCLERDPKDRPMTRKPWPSKKPLPRFATEEKELAFWARHDVPWDDHAQWEEVPGPVVGIAATKPKTLRVTLPASQEVLLGRLAKQRHVTKEKALEAIISEALGATARAPRRKRAAGA